MTVAGSRLLAADPAVAQRDRLLDGDEMAERMTSCLGAAIDHCQPVRARYQVGRSLRMLYRVSSAGSPQLVALRTFPGTRSEAVFRRVAHVAQPSGALPGVAHDRELRAVLFTFPNDRKVAGLRALMKGATRLVAWVPEKCATARCTDGDGKTVAFAKAYAGDDGARTRRIHDALHARAAQVGLRLPRATSYVDRRRTLMCEAIDGRAPAQLAGAQRERDLRRLGVALALLHGLEPPPEAAPFARFDRDRLTVAAETIGRARPDCRAAAQQVLHRLLATAPAPGDPACLHGDVHLKNALLVQGGAALIDLDQVSAGPAAADLGSLLAALRYTALVDDVPARQARAQADAFLAGYAGVRPPPGPDTLAWHLAAALFAERALRTVTRVRVPGLVRLPDLLAQAAQALERGA